MDFVEEYKSLIYSLLYNGEYEQAIMLRNSARKIWKSYDEEMCYIEALVEYSTYHFPLALFWAERGYRINPDYQPNKEFIELLRNEVIEFSDYNYLFPYDVSFLNKKLRIIIHCGVSPLMDYTGKLLWKCLKLWVTMYLCLDMTLKKIYIRSFYHLLQKVWMDQFASIILDGLFL